MNAYPKQVIIYSDVKGWECSDGKVYQKFTDAEKHQKQINETNNN